jgi:hypothetical protein
MTRISIVATVVFAVVAGCGSKKEGESSSGGAPPAPAKSETPAKTESGGGGAARAAVKLPKLGLTIDAPGEVSVGDAIVGEGHMLQGSGVGALNVEVGKPQTLDEAKEDAKLFSPANLKTETLADGWAMTFENKGSMGTNYWVDVRRTIDGKLYKCSTTGSDAGQSAAALAACKSLRKG